MRGEGVSKDHNYASLKCYRYAKMRRLLKKAGRKSARKGRVRNGR